MVFDLVDKEGTKSGKGLGWSWFGLNDGKRDAKILRELGEAYKQVGDHTDLFDKKIKGLTASSRDNARAIRDNNVEGADLSKGFLDAAASADKMTISSRAAELGMKTLSVGVNMFAGFAAGLALNVALEFLDNVIHREEKLKEKAIDMRAEYDNVVSTISSMHTELKTASDRISELQSKGSLSIVEQEELDRLRLSNVELERQIRLKEELQPKAAQDSDTAVVNSFNANDYIPVYDVNTGLEVYSPPEKSMNNIDKAQADMAKIESLTEQQNLLNQQFDRGDISAREYNLQIAKLSASEDIYRQSLSATMQQLGTTDSQLLGVTEESKSLKDAISGLIVKYLEMSDTQKSTKFGEIIEDEKYKGTAKKLDDLASKGILTADTLNGADYTEFINELIKAGVISGATSEELQKVATSFNDKYATEGADTLIRTNAELASVLTKVDSAMSSVADAYKEQVETGKISLETLSGLIASDENWINLVTIENGVIKLNSEAILQTARDTITAEIERLTTTRDSTLARIESYNDEIEALKKLGTALANTQMLKLADDYDIHNLIDNAAKMDAVLAALTDRLNGLKTSDPFNNLAKAAEKAAQAAAKLANEQYKAQGEVYKKAIDKQIDALNRKKKTETEYYDKKIADLNAEKEALQDKYTEEDKLLNLELKKQALEKANSQKTANIYREGEGFVYEADSDAVDDAQQELSDTQRDFEQYQIEQELDKQIKAYEEAKKSAIASIDSQIENWKELKDSVEEQMSFIGDTIDEHNTSTALMAEAEKMSLAEMSAAVTLYADHYIAEMERVKAAKSSSGSSVKDNHNIDSDGSVGYAPGYTPINNYAQGRVGGQTETAIVDELRRKEIIARTLGGRITHLEYGDSVIPADISQRIMSTWLDPRKQMVNQILNSNTIPHISSPTQSQTILQFSGDLSFPNITSGNDAQSLINELSRMGNLAYQK